MCAELEHLKIETRLTNETPVSEMGEYASDVIGVSSIFKLTHRAAALAKLLPIFALSCPRKAARLKFCLL